LIRYSIYIICQPKIYIVQESERAVLGRIVLTWGLGLVLASPIPVLAVVDIEHVMAAHDR